MGEFNDMVRDRHEAKARRLEEIVNDMCLNEQMLCDIVAHDMHRTNQQAFTRLCVAWLKHCGSTDYRYDGRNEASAHIGQALRKHLEDIYLPFI